jgi:hypothetical protein
MKKSVGTSPPFTIVKLSSLLVAAALSAACASTAPNPREDSSSAAIRAAEEVGGAHTPEAALHLQLAKEQRLPNTSDKGRVDRLLMRAQADAELSLALARSEAEKAEAQGAIDKVKSLKTSAVQ